MSCLGQCGDCTCTKVDMCLDTTKRNEHLDNKLKVLKDYSCLLATTTCVKLPQRIGQYSYFLWCYLRDLSITTSNLEKRVDNLCSVVKCQDDKINTIIKHLIGDLTDVVDFGMFSGDSDEDGRGYDTQITTDKTGNFTIKWSMNDYDSTRVGNGTIIGKVDHRYSLNDQGKMVVNIKSFTLNKATYTVTSHKTPNHSASFKVKDAKGTVIWARDYDPQLAWSETINKTVAVNKTFTLEPNGGTTGNVLILTTLDTWVTNPSTGYVGIKYTNKHNGVVIPNKDCNIKCTSCEHKEG